MKKQLRRFKVDFDFNWTYGVDIKKLREDLDRLEKLGVTSIEIEAYENYGCASITIEAFTERMETDEECKARINNEKKRQDEITQRELAQLETLKKKYGK
jgi:hypothetical protein